MSFDLQVKDGDLILDNGDFAQVVDTEKLIQDLIKIAVTDAGSNPLNPWYGSFISRSIIGSTLGTNVIIQVAQSQLQNSIENLMTLQKNQVKSFQAVSASELIAAIVSININQVFNNPSLFQVNISVLSKAFLTVSAAFTVETI